MNTKDLVCLCLEQFAMDSIIKFDTLRCKIAGGGVGNYFNFTSLFGIASIAGYFKRFYIKFVSIFILKHLG
jgi:hypothetical protein